MNLPVNFQDESTLRAAFSYLTRIGAAPAFGSRPIGWYQTHQVKAIEILESAFPAGGVLRCRAGIIEGKAPATRRWERLFSADALFSAADTASRG